jgi:hypothetical protein
MNGQKKERKSRFENEAPNGEKRCRRKCARKRPPGKEIGYRTGGAGVADQSVQTKICPRWRGAGILLVDPVLSCFVGGMGGSGTSRQFAGCACCLGLQAVKARMEGPAHGPFCFLGGAPPSTRRFRLPAPVLKSFPDGRDGICWVRSMRVRAPKRLKFLCRCAETVPKLGLLMLWFPGGASVRRPEAEAKENEHIFKCVRALIYVAKMPSR